MSESEHRENCLHCAIGPMIQHQLDARVPVGQIISDLAQVSADLVTAMPNASDRAKAFGLFLRLLEEYAREGVT